MHDGISERGTTRSNLVPRVSLLCLRPREAEKRDPGNEVVLEIADDVAIQETCGIGKDPIGGEYP